ncbi:hypothetical protein J4226_00390 [Candidatus Pacearchaeota archaeon]|nr:hypothetical protein [Candidatus Pacearchaeota archaeon]
MDVEFIGQLVDSMEDGISKLEIAIEKHDSVSANKLRVFIFDIHRKISEALRT